MPIYRKCPRCELNYILHEKDYCDVCLLELKGVDIHAADVDDSLCPGCHEIYLEPGEVMCSACALKARGAKAKAEVEEDEVEPGSRLANMTEEEDWDADADSTFDTPSVIDDTESFVDDGDYEDEDYEDEDYDEEANEILEEGAVVEVDDFEEVLLGLDDLDDDDLDDDDFDEDELEMDLDDLGSELGLDEEDYK